MRSLLLLILLLGFSLLSFSQQLTYYKDVEPIIRKNCSPCHRPDEAGPFSLVTYADVAKRASFIKDVVSNRYMPPWRADNRYVHFANDRSLQQKDIDLIVKWVDNKAPEGVPVTRAVPVKEPVAGTMYGRKPDLVLKMSDSFMVKGDGGERFILFKIPFELKDSANVEAIEFFSNDKKLVHHVNYAFHPVPDTAVDIYNTSTVLNLSEDDRRKFDQYQPYRKTITYYGGWIPGASYESYPADFGWVMPRRGVVLLTVHYAPAANDLESICGVNLFFKKSAVKRPVKVISFGSGGIGEKEISPAPFYIKPNEVKTFHLNLSNPGEAFSIMYVWPHMHYIGKEYRAYLTSAKGDTTNLVHIPDWDFRWQEIYKFRKLVKVPKGSVIHIEGTYDNRASNAANPNNPPQTIWSFGDMQSTNEMMTLMMVFLPYRQGDERKCVSYFFSRKPRLNRRYFIWTNWSPHILPRVPAGS